MPFSSSLASNFRVSVGECVATMATGLSEVEPAVGISVRAVTKAVVGTFVGMPVGLLVTGPSAVGGGDVVMPTGLSDEGGDVIESAEDAVGSTLVSAVGTSVVNAAVGVKVVDDVVGNADGGVVVGGFEVSCSFNGISSFFRMRSPAWPFCAIGCLRTRR